MRVSLARNFPPDKFPRAAPIILQATLPWNVPAQISDAGPVFRCFEVLSWVGTLHGNVTCRKMEAAFENLSGGKLRAELTRTTHLDLSKKIK